MSNPSTATPGAETEFEVTPELKVLAFETESGTCVAKLGASGFSAQSENRLVQQATVFNPATMNAAHGSL